MQKAVRDVKEQGCNALVVFLGNFGPETPETLIAKHFDGPCMFVAAGRSYITVDLVYQSVDQLRGMPLLDLAHPPVVYPLAFMGLLYDADGLCPAEKMEERLKSAIDRYDELLEQYGLSEAA